MALPGSVSNLAALVRYLADKYHGGSVYPMTDRTGLSNATLNKWVHSRVASPDLVSLFKLADGYGEDRGEVLGVAFKRPLVPRRRAKKALGFLLAAGLTALLGGAAHAMPEPATTPTLRESSLDRLRLIGSRRRLTRWGKWLTTLVTGHAGDVPLTPSNWLRVRTINALA